MTRTIVESKTKTAVIGFDEPFCVIGERINPTGRKKLAAELEAGDYSTVEGDAVAQAAAGATVLDINAGVVYNSNPNPNETEPPLMTAIVELVQGLVDLPLVHRFIGSGSAGGGASGRAWPAAAELGDRRGREAGIRAAAGQEIQCAGGGDLQRRYRHFRGPGRALCRGEKDRRARRRFRHPAHDIVVDPLVMPVGAMGTAGRQVFTLVRRLRQELGVNTTCGASNISFGLPNRHGINNAFLPMAMEAGMTSAIMNPIALPVKQAEIEAKKAEVAATGLVIPEDMEDETFCQLFGLGSTRPARARRWRRSTPPIS